MFGDLSCRGVVVSRYLLLVVVRFLDSLFLGVSCACCSLCVVVVHFCVCVVRVLCVVVLVCIVVDWLLFVFCFRGCVVVFVSVCLFCCVVDVHRSLWGVLLFF